MDIKSSFADTELSNNVKETIDSLGIGFAVLESRPIPSCISTCTVRCKRLNNNNLVDVPIDTISNHHESGLVVGVLNAQSTRNKTDRICAAIIEHDVDILALTETWLTSTAKVEFFIKSLTLSGYKLYSVPRKGNRGYGGVAILHKANITVSSKSSDNVAKSFEHCDMVFKTGSRSLHVCVVYRPPPSKNKLTTSMFFEEFTPFLQDRSLSAEDFIMVGDTNFHLDKSTDHDVNKFLTLLYIFYFKQHVASFTHRSGHMLDVVVTKNNQNIVQDTIVGDMISDHNIIVFKVLHPKPKPIRVSVTTRKCRDVDMSAVKADISAKLSVDANVSSASELTTVYNETLDFSFG